MNLTKIRWSIRALLYSVFYRNIIMPSYIGKPTYISNIRRISFGRRVRIYPGMRAEIVNSDAKIEIGDNTSIGQNFHVVSGNGLLKIGSNVTIAGNVFITNCDHDYTGDAASILENTLQNKRTSIGDECFIGNNVAILAGTSLGRHCVVGANSVVRGVVPEGTVIVGSPAKEIKRLEKRDNSWEKL